MKSSGLFHWTEGLVWCRKCLSREGRLLEHKGMAGPGSKACAARGPPLDGSAITTKDAAQQALQLEVTQNTHPEPLGHLLPISGQAFLPPGTVESWRSTDTLVRSQGNRILKRQTPLSTLRNPHPGCLCGQVKVRGQRGQSPPCHHVIFTEDFLLAHRRDT